MVMVRPGLATVDNHHIPTLSNPNLRSRLGKEGSTAVACWVYVLLLYDHLRGELPFLLLWSRQEARVALLGK